MKIGLVSYWKCNEASGTRNDSHGTNHLTQNGTVGQAAGKLTNAAVFDGNVANFLRCTDNPSLSMGTSVEFTMTCWFMPTANPPTAAFSMICGKAFRTAVLSDFEYTLGFDGGQLQSLVSNGGSNTNITTVDLTDSGWNFCVTRVRSNAGSPRHMIQRMPNSANEPGTAAVWAFDGGNPFTVGGFTTSSRMIIGRVCEIGLWKRALSDTDLTNLYNSSNGLPYESF